MVNNEIDAEGALRRFLSNLEEKPSGVSPKEESILENLNNDDKRMDDLAVKDKEVDIDLKERYGNTILNILIGWLFFVGVIIFIWIFLFD